MEQALGFPVAGGQPGGIGRLQRAERIGDVAGMFGALDWLVPDRRGDIGEAESPGARTLIRDDPGDVACRFGHGAIRADLGIEGL